MGRKSKFSKEIKVQACKDFLLGKKSIIQISVDLDANESSVREWVEAYVELGEYAFENKIRNAAYSKEFKKQVIKDYLSGKGSYLRLSAKYNVPKSVVFQWVKLYNSGEEIKEYDPRAEVYTMKARKTTFKERLDIVKFVLDHDKDYKLAAEKYLLPYSLIYQWTQKYLKQGVESLKYQKKGPKPKDIIPDELSDKDKLLRENELLRRQLEYARLENQILKKKEQLERQAELQRLGRKKRT